MKSSQSELSKRQREQIIAMKKQGMTQKAIAEIIGCSRTTVHKYLNHKKEETSKIRPYTETSNILIIQDLERGWSIQQIADMYDRDPADLKRHISKLLQDGTAGRIKRMLTAYRRHNTLARGSGLM